MKTLYALFTVSITCSVTFAQNLTRTDIGYTIGESYTIYSNNQYLDPGSSSNGSTWDLSGITPGPETQVSVLANTSGDYPSADVRVQHSTGTKFYYTMTNSAMDLVGRELSITSIDYSNSARFLAFPVTASLNQTDQYQAIATFPPDVFNRTGSVQIEYSGYGTLITPVGTYTNVVRIKTTESYTDVGPGGTYTTSIEAYDWYKAGIHREIAHYSVTTSGGGMSPSAYYTDATASVNEPTIVANVWPNPAQDYLNFQSAETVKSITITNIQGQVIQTMDASAKTGQMEVADLPSGMYIAKFELENGEFTLKQFSKK